MTRRCARTPWMRRRGWSRAGCALGAALALIVTASQTLAQAQLQSQPREQVQPQAPNASRHLACARGDLSVCQSLADQLRIAPGVRAAAKQLLEEVDDGMTRCDRGEVDACAELLERYPDLPPPVRESLAAAMARAKQK